jgi:hypothetical protein
MNFSAYLYLLYLLLIIVVLLSLSSVRLSIVLNIKDNILAYEITGSLFKYIKIFEVKSGVEKKGARIWKKYRDEKRYKGDKNTRILKKALKERKTRMIHVEKLLLEGTYSIGDAAANAILFGIFMALWQILLIYLNEHFKLDHQNFKLKPDFHNDRNDVNFHVVLRTTVYKIIWLLCIFIISTHMKNKKEFNTEYFYT